jgi:hypothetical protein
MKAYNFLLPPALNRSGECPQPTLRSKHYYHDQPSKFIAGCSLVISQNLHCPQRQPRMSNLKLFKVQDLSYLNWLIRLNGKYSLEAFETDGFESLIFFCVEIYSQPDENFFESR